MIYRAAPTGDNAIACPRNPMTKFLLALCARRLPQGRDRQMVANHQGGWHQPAMMRQRSATLCKPSQKRHVRRQKRSDIVHAQGWNLSGSETLCLRFIA